MAGVIRISGKVSWAVSNWVYWGLMDHVIDGFADDEDAARQIKVYKWMQSLSIPMLKKESPARAEKVMSAIRSVAEKCASGELECSVEGRVLDAPSQAQFREAAKELVDLLES